MKWENNRKIEKKSNEKYHQRAIIHKATHKAISTNVSSIIIISNMQNTDRSWLYVQKTKFLLKYIYIYTCNALFAHPSFSLCLLCLIRFYKIFCSFFSQISKEQNKSTWYYESLVYFIGIAFRFSLNFCSFVCHWSKTLIVFRLEAFLWFALLLPICHRYFEEERA